MSTRSRSPDSREHSPDGHEKRASKKRKVLSCYACRSRKMKCDRIYPVCGRCQKTGRADQCTYDPRLLEDLPLNGDGHMDGPPNFPQADNASSGPVSSDVLTWKLRVQERRVDMMEKKLAGLDSANNPSSDVLPFRLDNSQPDEPHLREEMMFRGKGFKTQFHGSTSTLSLLAQFGELQAFTREAVVNHSNFARIRDDFSAFRARRKAALKEKRQKYLGQEDEVYALIPEKPVLDRVLALYFHTWETSYRFLHEPTFWKDYQTFWDQRSNLDSPTAFAAILVYIVAITKCLEPKEQNIFVGDSSADRESALELIETCDAWLLRQSRKRLTLSFFQLQCLSLFSKRVNCLKVKQDWVSSGDLVRLAIASGLHRKPSLLVNARITEYEKEMRRRLWLTIVELEIQSSVDCGLQSSVCGLYFDVQPPANLPDDAFSSDTQQIPAGRPIEHFTSTSYLNVALRSLPLRTHLLQLLNNPTTDLHYSDVLHYDAQIASLLSSFPSWNDPRAAVPGALLELQLRQFLLILHRPYAKLGTRHRRYIYSFTACIDAAGAILPLCDNLISKGILALNNARNDVLRVTATLAQVVYYNCLYSSASTPIAAPPSGGADINLNPKNQPHPPTGELKIPQLPANNLLASTLCTTAISLLEKARELYEHKIIRLGTGYMEYWLICGAMGIMPATDQPATSIASIINAAPDDLRSRGRKALDRVVSHCFRVLALQKDPENSFASSLRTSIEGVSPVTPASNMSSSGPPTTFSHNSLPTVIPGASAMAGALAEGKSIGGPFDDLQDMQVDLGGWAFPDFWAYDMAGTF